jgi:hypothetical protein
MEITLKGQPRILTIRVAEKFMDIMLTDLKGNQIEYMRQEGNRISLEKPGK